MIDRLNSHTGPIFALATVCTALFFLLQDGFFTLDGWAHGANARLFWAVFTNDPAFTGLVSMNPWPVPNWGGHVLLALLQRLLPALWAEKALLALLILVQASGCARYAKAISGRRNALILLCLPALLGQVFVFGFYNLMLSMGAALWFAAWWSLRSTPRWYHWPLLGLACLVIYFCHGSGVPFFLLLMLCGNVAGRGMPGTVRAWVDLAAPVIACVPVLAMLVSFDRGQGGDPVFLGAPEVFDRIRRFTWLAPYDGYRERAHVLLFVVGLLCGALAVIFGRRGPAAVERPLWWPLLGGAALLLGACFVLPDDTGYASYITLRTVSLAFLLITIALAAQPTVEPRIALGGGALALISLVLALRFMAVEGAQARADRDVVLRAAAHFEAGDVVLPVWRDDRWLFQHRADLLGLERPVLLLENSQNNKRYCPVVWGGALPEAFNRVAHYADPGYAALSAHLRSGQQPPVDHLVFMGPRLDLAEQGLKKLRDLADSLGYRAAFHERDVLVMSRP